MHLCTLISQSVLACLGSNQAQAPCCVNMKSKKCSRFETTKQSLHCENSLINTSFQLSHFIRKVSLFVKIIDMAEIGN